MKAKGQGLVEYALILILVAVLVIIGLSLIGGIKFTDYNAIPTNVQHSTVASPQVLACMQTSTGHGKYSNVYREHQMIECLYAAGFTLEYNGEPVRRETNE